MEYIAEIKEGGHTNVLTPSISGSEMTKEELIDFWGLANDDVEWYKLYQVINGEKEEIDRGNR